MKDNTFIYYLILGVIYLVSRLLKNKKPANTPKPKQVSRPQGSTQQKAPQRPTSFEDILKELTKELTPEEHRKPKVIQVEEPKPVKVKQEPKEELTREQQYVKKRHAEMELERKLALAKAEAEKPIEHEPHEVLELLREEGGAANAIILSEILNRKY